MRGRRPFARPLLLPLVLLVPGAPPAAAQDTTSVLLQRRVYAVAPTGNGDVELVVDLYRPLGRAPKGAVVLMHGGGFTGGSVDIGENKVYGQALAQRGYLGAAIAYRLHRDAPLVDGWAEAYARVVGALRDLRTDAAIEAYGPDWPLAVGAAGADLVAAVGWLRGHADEIGFARDDIALFGASAGGVTALTAAYALDSYGGERLDVAGVIALRGFLFRADSTRDPFDPGAPPLLILHGARDRRVPLPEAEAVFRLAAEARTPVELYTSEAHGHDLGGPGLLALRIDGGSTVLDRIDAFLDEVFRGEARPGRSRRGRLGVEPQSPPSTPSADRMAAGS